MPTHARPAGSTDVEGITELFGAVEEQWWGQPETDAGDVRHILAMAGEGRTRVVESDGRIVAVATLLGDDNADLLVHPDLDDRLRSTLFADLAAWILSHGRRELESPVQDTWRADQLRALGWSRVWSSYELERPASSDPDPTVWPSGIAAAPFDLDRDAAEVHELVYSVWTDVPGHHARSLEEWRLVFCGHEGFDPSLVVLARRGEELVGVAICRVYSGTDGWVSQLAVGRDARGLGVGRALLQESIARLSAIDTVKLVGLSVMADNANALGLYRSVGLEVTRELTIWLSPTGSG